MLIHPIAVLRSPLKQKFGAPRQPGLVDLEGQITFHEPYGDPAAFEGIEQFTHLWLVWQFHAIKPNPDFVPRVRPPRLGGNLKVGVFATRSMFRPNPLGLSVVKLKKVELIGSHVTLWVQGADLIDGTPIFDIKPYLPYSDAVAQARAPGFDAPNNRDVTYQPSALDQLAELGLLADQSLISAVIAQDPRPAYRMGKPDDKRYTIRWKNSDIAFEASDRGFEVIAVSAVSGETAPPKISKALNSEP